MPTMPSVTASSKAPALALLLLAASIAASQAGVIICGDFRAASPSPAPAPAPAPLTSSITTTNNSAFHANVLTLMNALPEAVAPTGFASLSLGAGHDRAFVRGLCSGGSNQSTCLASLQVAVRDFGGRCVSSKSAAALYRKCYISYADTNDTKGWWYQKHFLEVLYDILRLSDPSILEPAYEALTSRLVAGAASSARLFATGEAEYYNGADPNGTLYGLVQCTMDLSATECKQCLRALVPVLSTCCLGYQGGVSWNFNCLLQVEIYPFYDTPPLAAPPPWSVPSLPSAGERHGRRRSEHAVLAVAISIGTLLVLVVVLVCVHLQRKKNKADNKPHDNAREGMNYISLQVLRAATSNFSIKNKLGEGGFGEVFKGELQDGKEIAVKRLSKNSAQGFDELKNELVLANRLKHKNLVQLLGVSFQEKLLVYEYMPNGSLDKTLFESEKAHQLDWVRRSTIIRGIARGLSYLHEESPLKIIHRDLKPSNVLLDRDMSPKISDFGLSRAFGGDQSIDITKRPVGTLGYLSPEYAYCGHVSTKSDMYSFGVIVLEIVTGRRNNRSLRKTTSRSLLSYVWEKWNAGSVEEVVDPSLGGLYPESEALRCVQIGLLCVQENPGARPDASEVVLMLNGHSASMRAPSRPAFCFAQTGAPSVLGNQPLDHHQDAAANGQPPAPVSGNDVTISDIQPR